MPTSPLAIGIDFGGTSVKFGVCAGAEIIAGTEPRRVWRKHLVLV